MNELEQMSTDWDFVESTKMVSNLEELEKLATNLEEHFRA